ncbi:hypothetical protein ABW19_dt0206128 [Dactylella cylindrospora]|nr:hypothetical protein ABW19_dt0206128 [Dactylella cylindrospora]
MFSAAQILQETNQTLFSSLPSIACIADPILQYYFLSLPSPSTSTCPHSCFSASCLTFTARCCRFYQSLRSFQVRHFSRDRPIRRGQQAFVEGSQTFLATHMHCAFRIPAKGPYSSAHKHVHKTRQEQNVFVV